MEQFIAQIDDIDKKLVRLIVNNEILGINKRSEKYKCDFSILREGYFMEFTAKRSGYYLTNLRDVKIYKELPIGRK